LQTIDSQQHQMRTAFVRGAPGMLVSATVWLVAGVVALRSDVSRAVWTLLVGGALIHPVSTVLVKFIWRRTATSPGNPLMHLAMASTIWLIVGCVLAYGLSIASAYWFFPAMLLVVGSRYLAFQLLYGESWYLVCGGVLIVTGVICGMLRVSPAVVAGAGGGIEALFGLVLLRRALVDVT
jgi:hypothetical protein